MQLPLNYGIVISKDDVTRGEIMNGGCVMENGSERGAIRDKVKGWLVMAGKIAGIAVAAFGTAYLIKQNSDKEKEQEEARVRFDYVTDNWMIAASEDELRATEKQMRTELEGLDYDSDEYLQLDLKRIDVVNTIASRFPLKLPKREHGWYLPNDE